MELGAVIVAAGLSSRMKDFKPLMKIDNTTIIEKVILTLKASGVEEIVVITGFNSELIEERLKKHKVICLHNKDYENTDMLHSAKIGFEYLKDKCDKVLFTPGDIPLFTENTVKEVIKSKAMVVKPSFNEKGGHPILVNAKVIPSILEYKGDGGLKNALNNIGEAIEMVGVKDEGILMDADTPEDYKRIINHNKRFNLDNK